MAQQVAPPTTPYGVPISLAAAKQAMAAAEAEATKNGWAVAIAIVDSGANLVMTHRLDNAQLSSVRIAEAKARTAAEFRRPTKVFEDAIAGGGIGLRVLTFGASVAEGGVPIVSGGTVVGAIGVSGVQSHQDAQIAQAGADAVK
ncbi:GlcG/HbpS family heme-binding protein [Rhodoplanes sp. Z2-YC6860]|uniref:GlcG/HbpS family heme-binding protein n=1 Tax=Rhodoplanes sp. Z2-YC6860 TaxID=674703 RepID=UPI00078CA1E7|nr:heme-binding protein [Rhodoplanes sp. Z2-YC6860]AMN43594.1 GlcG protein [Rhodoplanes sp. Z2-YC6860]